jgi:hypothetical protein
MHLFVNVEASWALQIIPDPFRKKAHAQQKMPKDCLKMSKDYFVEWGEKLVQRDFLSKTVGEHKKPTEEGDGQEKTESIFRPKNERRFFFY